MLLHVVPTYVFRKNERKKRMHATGIKGYDGYRARLSSALWTCVGLYCGQHATTTILLKNQIPIRVLLIFLRLEKENSIRSSRIDLAKQSMGDRARAHRPFQSHFTKGRKEKPEKAGGSKRRRRSARRTSGTGQKKKAKSVESMSRLSEEHQASRCLAMPPPISIP
ncbi:hypothetical protein BRADI_3g56186v3 [Brachypodium distachyon]|uniref:Uncharacterized protein n=1 Tax=Brachypodium distachyon TaxID=15368 RepID=A0A2K2D5C3_BRADI|nr:hypothetical protein BRADI_3g56186v3 [Brachypodium distachyon]